MKKLIFSLVVFIPLLFFSPVLADIIPINLNNFYADPSVTVAADGSSAIMLEDQSLIAVLLSNDPFLGDPGIAVPPGLLALSFNYSFTLETNNNDNFYAKLFDGDTGDILADFLSNSTSSGAIIWALSSLGPGITLLGLEFQLNSNDSFFDSFVVVSNVQMETAATPVPEPGTLILLGSGLLGLIGIGRKKFLHII